MKFLDKCNQVLGFTPNETRVVVFLILAFVAGGAIKVFRNSSQKETAFDYTSSDSEFAVRSLAYAAGDSGVMPTEEGSAQTLTRPAFHPSKSHDTHLSPGSVDLNSATKGDLKQLPGVGEATADEIIRYRAEHGSFKTTDELLNVKGIGKKKLERILPFLSLRK